MPLVSQHLQHRTFNEKSTLGTGNAIDKQIGVTEC